MKKLAVLLLLTACSKHVPVSLPLNSIQTREHYSFRELKPCVYAVAVYGDHQAQVLKEAEKEFHCGPMSIETAPVKVFILSRTK